MAVFNPDVPDSKPKEALSYSHPARQPEFGKQQADTSMGELFKGVGNVLEAGLKTTDFLYKKGITDELRPALEAERDAYTNELVKADISQNIGSGGSTAQTAAVSAERQPRSILAADQTNLPKDLANLPQYAENIASARAAGKISDTYYHGRLLSIAKSMRAKYPGYVDYIDSEVSRITGVTPANAYMASIKEDIAKGAASARTDQDKALAILNDKDIMGLPGTATMVDRVKAGQATLSDVYRYAYPLRKQKLEWELKAEIRKDKEGQHGELKLSDTKDLELYSGQTVSNYFNNILSGSGLNTPDNVRQMVLKHHAGQEQLTAPEATQLAAYVRSQRSTAEKAIRDFAVKQGWMKTVGSADANKIIAEHLKTYDDVADMLTNNQTGAAFTAANMAKAKTDQAYSDMLGDRKWGDVMTRLSALEKMPAFAKKYFELQLIKGTITDPGFQSWLTDTGNKMLTQTGSDIRALGGQPFTVKMAVEEAEKKGLNLPQVYEQLISKVELLNDPTTPYEVRKNLAKAFYHESNRGLLSKFEQENRDPNTGKVRTDQQYSIFKRLTSPAITAQMKEFYKTEPDIFFMYKDYAEQTVTQELARREFNDFKDFTSMKSVEIGWNDGKEPGSTQGLVVAVDPLIDRYLTGKPVNERKFYQDNKVEIQHAAKQATDARRMQSRLNSAFLNLRSISEVTGEDPNNYIFRLLRQNGANLEKLQWGVPEEILKSALAEKEKADREAREREKGYKQ